MWDKPQLLMWLANLLYALATVLFLYAVLFFVINLPIFPLRHIKIDGDLQYVSRPQVEVLVKKDMRGNFFTLNLDRTRLAFEKLPWVRKVSVRRYWPDRLVVTVEEHRALARWGNLALVNTQGELFQAESEAELPKFIGPAGSEADVTLNYLEFSRILQPLKQLPVQVTLSPRRAWQVRTNTGMTLELGREQVEQRLRKFVAVYAHSITPLQRRIGYVDLRYSNGFAVRIPELKGKEMPVNKTKKSAWTNSPQRMADTQRWSGEIA